jgi:uncharacterized lipoprotein NlpE involved in copper resistance
MEKNSNKTFVIFTLISCNNQNQKKMIATDNEKKLVKQYFEHFNNHEWTKNGKICIPNFEFKTPFIRQGIVKQTRQ